MIVFRINAGCGIPTYKETSLPYEKRYFSGGAISLRGWKIRTLGPGTYNDVNNTINRTGDLKFEGNLEYRFSMLKFFGNILEGALFTDFGNIWLIKENSNFVGAHINWQNFKEGMAADIGLGFRFNFQFFVIRLDAAVPMRDPSLTANNRWVYKNYTNYKNVSNAINLNFGIGYPF